MDDVWIALGLTRRDFEAFLRALALNEASHPPLLAIGPGPASTASLLLASRSLFRLFGCNDDRGLSARLLAGRDPGARRLADLARTLPLEGAPRLERMRFFIGPGSEIITFLCRRLTIDSGGPVFVAAALDVRAGLIPPAHLGTISLAVAPPDQAVTPPGAETAPQPAASPVPAGAQAIQASLRTRWPTSRTVRFLWRSDPDSVCTMVSSPLADIVGAANADLVGRRLLDLAPGIDPSGRLAAALAGQTTWSGLDVSWPIVDEAAGIHVGLGGIPAFDRERAFEGYSGYGVIHLDRITPRDIVRLTPAAVAPPVSVDNVVRFPGKALSLEDQAAFATLGAELRDHAGLAAEVQSTANLPPAAPVEPAPTAHDHQDAVAPADVRAADIARNGLALLDTIGVSLLVSRASVPIFANRHLLDLLGFADEDALHAAGGMTHLFGGQPGNASGSEAIGLRAANGTIIPTHARMQHIDWDSLPATLLTLHPLDAKRHEPASRVEPPPAELPAAPPHAAPIEPPREEALDRHTSEARELRAILETATDGVAVIDGACNILSLNRSGEALFGRDRSEVIGKPFLSLFAPPDQDRAADYFEGLKSSATKSLLNDGREILVKARNGEAIPVFMTLGRLGPFAGDAPAADEPSRFCALFRDLTQWKKVEQDLDAAKREAERASALKTDFLAKVSHEVRTPLNAIIGFAEVIMEERFGPVGNERYREYLRDIHASGTHVMSLVNDLLDLSKIEAGKMELAVDDVDANKVIGECVALMQPQASRERVIMRLSLSPRLPRIKADERSLRQIVLNLLSNAVKFNEPGGQVIVATTMTEAGHAVIRIRDTGPGMSEADIVAALEPFRQLATNKKGGTGLGLPLTKALVEANQAAFTVKSKVDQGTLVEVAFPPARVLAS